MTTQSVDGVLIVGGGYAGVHTARSVRQGGFSASIVDPTGRHEFVTRLAAVAGGTAPTTDASAPLEDFVDTVIRGTMTAVRDGEIDLDDGTTLVADALVVTVGSRPVTPPVEGLDLAWPLRSEADALALRAEIEGTESVTIIGGGATGVQLAGAIAVAHPSISITLIEGNEQLLTGMRGATSRDALRVLSGRGVDVRFGDIVDSIESDGVMLDGERIAGLPVWAAGFEAAAGDFGFPITQDGRVPVDRYLRVDGWERTFAAGDITLHPDGNGGAFPMSAQIAVQAGDAAGRNAVSLMRDKPLTDVKLDHKGWVIDLGGHRGLAEIGPFPITAPFLDLFPPALHWGIDMKHLIETRGLAGISNRPGA